MKHGPDRRLTWPDRLMVAVFAVTACVLVCGIIAAL